MENEPKRISELIRLLVDTARINGYQPWEFVAAIIALTLGAKDAGDALKAERPPTLNA